VRRNRGEPVGTPRVAARFARAIGQPRRVCGCCRVGSAASAAAS